MTLVHIAFNVRPGPWGGGNQFLRALREEMQRRGVYAARLNEADVVLVNSHHQLFDVVRQLRSKPDARILHRMDGPVDLIRGFDDGWDTLIHRFATDFADGIVYQSLWSRTRNLRKSPGMADRPDVVIPNAPPPGVFFPPVEKQRAERIRLITTSWSSNPRKGFDILRHLDATLDDDRYDMTFVGNSPVDFERITHIPPIPREALAEELRRHDIFIAASLDDPCSNALLEALHSGLPVAYRNSGGHPELVGRAGAAFDGVHDVWSAIEDVAARHDEMVRNFAVPGLEEICTRYLDFADAVRREPPRRQRGNLLAFLRLRRAHVQASARALARSRILPRLRTPSAG